MRSKYPTGNYVLKGLWPRRLYRDVRTPAFNMLSRRAASLGSRALSSLASSTQYRGNALRQSSRHFGIKLTRSSECISALFPRDSARTFSTQPDPSPQTPTVIEPTPDAPLPRDSAAQAMELSTSQELSHTAADYLQAFHESVSFGVLPWAATIPLTALTLRLISLPLVYHNQIHVGRAALANKELPRIQAFVRKTPGTLLQKYLTFRRLRNLTFRSAGTSQIHLFRWHIFVHLPLVISASMGMRELSRRVPDEWRLGGFGWFTDLTMSDPTGVLPVFTTGLWLWNLDPRSLEAPSKHGDSSKKTNALERIMSGTGIGLARILQVVAVVSLSVTTELPSGLVLFWACNGLVTGAQRFALSHDGMRRRLGLLTAEDVRQASGPPVMQSTETAVEHVRKELSYVQQNVLSTFKNRRVDEKLCKDVNRMLKRERWSGRITVDLEAVVRSDDRDGKKYVAVVRRGTA